MQQPIMETLKRNMVPQTLKKKRRFLLSKTKQRSKLPIRVTSCIFKKPVTAITSHPANKVWYRPQEKVWEKPKQIYEYRRLQGLQAYSSAGALLSTFDVMKDMKTVVPRSVDEFLDRVGPGSLHSSPKPTMAQSSDWAEVVPGAGVWVPQLLRRQLVTHADIYRQALKVEKARERLAVALRADRVAWEAERAREEERESQEPIGTL